MRRICRVGFRLIYDVMKAMEESGKIRRGYFAADLGATQFAMPAAVDLLRSLRVQQEGEKWRCCSWRRPIRRILMGRCCVGRRLRMRGRR